MIKDTKTTELKMNRYDPDVHRKTYSVRQIAGSYQASHVSIDNMPTDGEFLYALSVNGHAASRLDELRAEYCRLSEVLS